MVTDSDQWAAVREGAFPQVPTTSAGRIVPQRALYDTSAKRICLDGEWVMRTYCSVPAKETRPTTLPECGTGACAERGITAWRTMEVPSHWPLVDDSLPGQPIYTNIVYPFPIDGARVPDRNPSADFVRTFTLDDADRNDAARYFLRFDGIESIGRIWVNDTWVGTTQGSRLSHEFDITECVHSGDNVLVVRVSQFSPGSYLEDQDQWWIPGIFRSVVLEQRPAQGVDDLRVEADFDPRSARGILRVSARTTAPSVHVVVRSLQGIVVDESVRVVAGHADAEFEDLEVAPWSDEHPNLYTVVVSTPSEEASLRTGFRRIEIVHGQVLANGVPLTIRGMNRHEVNATCGRVFDEEFVRSDMALMKAMNVNAIRTSHYTPHPRILDLADELGFWVMEEADYETHGFEFVGWKDNPSDTPMWHDALLERTERTVLRDRNHPCIFAWSLGNESGTGRNLADAAALVRRLDSTRPVHYERDYRCQYSDFYSRMYPTREEVSAALADSGPIAAPYHVASDVTPADAARARTKPYLLVEYAHAMGTGPGGIEDWFHERHHPRFLGGFVWEWRDHALWATRDGVRFLAYGGDFGEEIHDANFVCDGMIDALSRPRSGLFTWANIVSPVVATPHEDGRVEITNEWVATSTEAVNFEWTVLGAAGGDDGVIARGHFRAAVPPEGHEVVTLPEVQRALDAARAAGTEAVFQVRVLDETIPGWSLDTLIVPHAPEGGSYGSEMGEWYVGNHAWEMYQRAGAIGSAGRTGRVMSVRELTIPALPSRATWSAVENLDPEKSAFTCESRLDGLYIHPVGAGDYGPIRAEFWRAPTDNDGGHGPVDYWYDDPTKNVGQGLGKHSDSSAEKWRKFGVDRMHRRVVSCTPGNPWSIVTRYSPASENWGVTVSTSIAARTAHDQHSGVCFRVTVDMQVDGHAPTSLPRMGVSIPLPSDVETCRWYGQGPSLSYADFTAGAFTGVFEGSVDALWEPTVVPQEAGHRMGLRELSLSGKGERVLHVAVVEGDVSFSVAPASPKAMDAAGHWYEVKEKTPQLILDFSHHGLGSRSCGSDVRPQFFGNASHVHAVCDVTFS